MSNELQRETNKQEYIKTPTTYCDGSSSFDQIDQGKYSIDISIQLIAILSLLIIGIRFFLFFPKQNIKFLSFRFDLFKIPLFENAVRSKYFSFIIRLLPAVILIIILATGFLGRTRLSLAAPFVWMFWWTLLIFFVAFFGKIFCAICPWDFFANFYQYGFVYKIKKVKETHLKKWPKRFRTVYPAIIFFIILTWLELGFEITNNSYATAGLGLFITMLAIAIPVFFQKRAFCRYLCPVGRISGIYSIFSPVELRVKSDDACKSCTTKECVKGNTFSSPCPMGLVPFDLKENTYCTLCTECIRSCDKKNLTLKLRPFASEINTIKPKSRKDESILSIVLFGLTFFHGITMVNPWFQMVDWLRNLLWIDYLTSFSILMIGFMFVLFLFFSLINRSIRFLSKAENTFGDIAICLIPITLAYHLGHNVMHVFGETQFLLPLLNDPFGWEWNIFGLKSFVPKIVLRHEDVLELQVLLIVVGYYFSVKTIRIKLQAFGNVMKTNVLHFQFLYFTGVSLLFFTGLFCFWLIGQPMVVRGGI